MVGISGDKKVCIILLHNRNDSGLYNYAEIYRNAYPSSTLLLLSDLYPNTSQWVILFSFSFFKKRIVKKIKNDLMKFDLVHICDNPIYSFKILNLLHYYKIATIFTLHDPQAHLENSVKSKIKNKIYIWLLSSIYKLISKSKYIKLHLHYNWPIPDHIKPIILPHPIYPLVNYKRRKQNDFLTIGFFGRLEYYKGYDIFIDLITKLDKIVIKNKVKVIIAGQGKVDVIDSFKNIDVEVQNGFIENSLFDSLIANSDLVLMPYRQASQSGILMKALSFEVPAMVSNLDELTSYLIPDITGIILDLDKMQSWLDKLVYYSNNIDEITILSINISNHKYKYEPSLIAKKLYNHTESECNY